MGVNDLATVKLFVFFNGHLFAYKIMQTTNADPATAFVYIIVVVAYLQEIMAIIKHADANKTGF